MPVGIKYFLDFLWAKRKVWLAIIAMIVLLIGLFVLLMQSSWVAPVIYNLF